jgi:hypothetical protein
VERAVPRDERDGEKREANLPGERAGGEQHAERGRPAGALNDARAGDDDQGRSEKARVAAGALGAEREHERSAADDRADRRRVGLLEGEDDRGVEADHADEGNGRRPRRVRRGQTPQKRGQSPFLHRREDRQRQAGDEVARSLPAEQRIPL